VEGQSTDPEVFLLAPLAPGIFSMNGQGTGQGAILDASYRLVDSSNPATAGSTVIQIFCTGLGPVTNQPPSGSPPLDGQLSETTTTPIVTIGGTQAQALFSGLAPGTVGIYQVNALVPAGIEKGAAVPVTVGFGARQSISGGVTSNIVTIAVQ
jgi:minor extracellular serine protease Vpr